MLNTGHTYTRVETVAYPRLDAQWLHLLAVWDNHERQQKDPNPRIVCLVLVLVSFFLERCDKAGVTKLLLEVKCSQASYFVDTGQQKWKAQFRE